MRYYNTPLMHMLAITNIVPHTHALSLYYQNFHHGLASITSATTAGVIWK